MNDLYMQTTKSFFLLRLVKYLLVIILINFILVSFLFASSFFLSGFGPSVFYISTFFVSVAVFFIVMFVFTNMRGNRANLEFASIIAHKLKNSLSAVKWSLRMYLDGDFGHITDEQRGVVSRLYEKNEAMILTLNNLLHFNDIENGVYSFRRTKVDLVPLIQAIINDYRDELNKKNIELDFKKPDFTFPKLMLDKEKIDSAIQNIFDNAAKYTPEDGSIKVFLKSDDKEVEIQISNSGPGIPKENQRNIFSTKMARLRKGRHNGSTGLGLFLARKVIMAHGGKIWFKSEDGQGNCFYIKLPIYK